MFRVHVESRREGRGQKAGDRGERRPFPAARVSAYSTFSGRCWTARCEMDTPPLSGSDSDSDDSLVTDREVGRCQPSWRARCGRRPYSPITYRRSGPAVAGCVFSRAPEAGPKCRARGAEESRE